MKFGKTKNVQIKRMIKNQNPNPNPETTRKNPSRGEGRGSLGRSPNRGATSTVQSAISVTVNKLQSCVLHVVELGGGGGGGARGFGETQLSS